jgi:enediyne biosynthesis protein E3
MIKINWGKIRRFVFGLPLVNIENTWKNVPSVETSTRQKLRPPVIAFITGFNTALEVSLSELLVGQLEGLNDNCRGFGYEGAGMGLAVSDYARNKTLVSNFLQGQGAKYPELIYVGVGCATAALKKDLVKKLPQIEPMQRWWIPDGFGFFTGIYQWEDSVERQIVPAQVKGYALRAFDRGLGRRMWFALSGESQTVAKAIVKFPESRQADLWSGIGLASTFAGGAERETLVKLKELAGDYASYVALGSTMAAKCRYTADNIVDYTNFACSILCGMTASQAGEIVTKVIEDINVDPQEPLNVKQPAFETMRENVRSHFVKVSVDASV